MGRIIIGAAAAAIAMFVIGFIFYATPLNGLAFARADDTQAAAVQQALAANLPRTGTYVIPDASTPQQTVMYGNGPIATVHYNIGGFSPADPAVILAGLALDFVVALLIGFALLGLAGHVTDFAARARIVVLFALGAAAFMRLGEPVWYHHDWGWFIYAFVADAAALIAAGLIIARWFLPTARAAPADAPTDV
jgi:hypothetical protein